MLDDGEELLLIALEEDDGWLEELLKAVLLLLLLFCVEELSVLALKLPLPDAEPEAEPEAPNVELVGLEEDELYAVLPEEEGELL